ncbi:MAG: NAD(P)H-binding protein [Gemmatimonadota bacterium]|nr:NAD(P)H-binding protein [Gemmatimonadota bacterium]
MIQSPETPRKGTLAVTGASGLLGRHLCDHFRRRGWEVRGLVRDPDAYPFSEAGVSLFRCNLPETLDEAALEGAEVLIHCAYTTRFAGLEQAQRVNEEGTRRVLAAARAAKVRRFVFISSISARPGAQWYQSPPPPCSWRCA